MERHRDHPDHVKVLSLLWRENDNPSPRTGLTVRRIVDAAVDIADRDGLPAVTMRRLGQELGVSTMSLYTYVPGRAELGLLMFDAVYAELPESWPTDAGWRAALETLAHDHWDLYRRHPWLVDLPLTRPAPGPQAMDRWEEQLRIVDGIGLDDLELNATIELIQAHVAGMAGRAVDISRDAERSGMSDEEWWYRILPVLTDVLSGRELPLSARVGEAIGAPHADPQQIFEFGLARILDGVEALVARRAAAD